MTYEEERDNNRQTYCLNAIGPKKRPGELWSLNKYYTDQMPIVKDKVLYISRNEKFQAIDAEKGKDLWTFAMPGEATPPAIFGTKLFIGGYRLDSNLYVVDKETGVELGRYSTGTGYQGVMNTPILIDNKVIFAAGKTVHAVNADTLKPVWRYKIKNDAGYFPLSSIRNLVFGSTDDGGKNQKVYCVNIESGEEIWKTKTPGLCSQQLARAEGLYFLDTENYLNCVDYANGAVQRSQVLKDESPVFSYLASCGELLLLAVNKALLALHVPSGQWAWTYFGKNHLQQPIIADGCVYVISGGRWLRALELTTGTVLFEFDTGIRTKHACTVEANTVWVAGMLTCNIIKAFRA